MPFRQEITACVPPPSGRLDPPPLGRLEPSLRDWCRRYGAPSPEWRDRFVGLAARIDSADGDPPALTAAWAELAGIQRDARRSPRWRGVRSRPPADRHPDPADLHAEVVRTWSALCFQQPHWFDAWVRGRALAAAVRRRARRAARGAARLVGAR